MWLVSFGILLFYHENFFQELDPGWRARRLIQMPTKRTSSALGIAQIAAGGALLGILEQPIQDYEGDINVAAMALILLCRMHFLGGLVAFSFWIARGRLEERMRLPSCANMCACARRRRPPRRKTKVRAAAFFLLLNLCCAEAVAVERALRALPEAHDSVTNDPDDLPPFSPYEGGFRHEGDTS